jgi:hypothetical protein
MNMTDERVAAVRAKRNSQEEARLRLIGEFETTRPTPTAEEADLLGGPTAELTMVKLWDLSPINPLAPDPTEPPGRPDPDGDAPAPPPSPPGKGRPPHFGSAEEARAWREQSAAYAAGEFETTNPTPLQSEADLLSDPATREFTLLKAWDLSPVNPNAFDPTEPPGRPGPPPVAPANTTPPTIIALDSLQPGHSLAGQNGVWTGTPAPTITRQWYRDDAPIGGATGMSYVLAEIDVGAMIGLTHTATNSAGAASADAAEVGPVLPSTPDEPINTAPPVLSGTARTGQQLTVAAGTWTDADPPPYAYVWHRGANDIGGATGLTYTLIAADETFNITVTETATNAAGSVGVISNAIGPVLPLAPTNTAPPTITGTAQVGQTLTAVNGTWNGAPTGRTHQWNGNGAAIGGQTGQTLVLAAAQLGQTITVSETASNLGGASTPATSVATAAVLPAAPVAGAAPVLSGNTVVGDVLTTTAGTWTGGAIATTAYQWKNASGNVAGALNQATYTLQAGDVGATIHCTVTATNTGGNASHDSNALGPITATARSR